MLDPKKAENFWLGAEALPAGLTDINRTIQAWAEARSRMQHPPLRESRAASVIGMATRWTQNVLRRN